MIVSDSINDIESTYNFSRYGFFITFISPFFILIALFIMLLKFFNVEYSCSTFRNKILSGIKRSTIFFTNFIFSSILYLGYVLISLFIVYTYSFAFNFIALPIDYRGGIDVLLSLIIILFNAVFCISFISFLSVSFYQLSISLLIYLGYVFFEFVFCTIVSRGVYVNQLTNAYLNISKAAEFFQMYQTLLTTNSTDLLNASTNFINFFTTCPNGIDTVLRVHNDVTTGALIISFDSGNSFFVILKTILTNSLLTFLCLFFGNKIFNKREIK